MVRGEGSRLRLFALQPISRGPIFAPFFSRQAGLRSGPTRQGRGPSPGRRGRHGDAQPAPSHRQHSADRPRRICVCPQTCQREQMGDGLLPDRVPPAPRLRWTTRLRPYRRPGSPGGRTRGRTPRPGCVFETADFVCHFVTPPHGFAPPGGVMTVDRLGRDVRVTTIERTIARRPARPL
jgi:hypothetical protein